MPIVTRFDEDGTPHAVRLRYFAIPYRVPPGFVAALRIDYEKYPEADIWRNDRDAFMHSYVRHKRRMHAGKEWMIVSPHGEEWCLECELTHGLGEIRELPPEEAWLIARENDLVHPSEPIPVEFGMELDPRYRTVVDGPGERTYYRVRYEPQHFGASEETLSRMRHESRGRGAKSYLDRHHSDVFRRTGPFRNYTPTVSYGSAATGWARLYGYDATSEFLIDVEVTERPDFGVRPLAPRETWERIVAWERGAIPELRFEDDPGSST